MFAGVECSLPNLLSLPSSADESLGDETGPLLSVAYIMIVVSCSNNLNFISLLLLCFRESRSKIGDL